MHTKSMFITLSLAATAVVPLLVVGGLPAKAAMAGSIALSQPAGEATVLLIAEKKKKRARGASSQQQMMKDPRIQQMKQNVPQEYQQYLGGAGGGMGGGAGAGTGGM